MKRALVASIFIAFASAAAGQSGNNLEIILELGEPEQLIEIQVVAVVDN